jgi:putative oxidoreductase
MWFHFHEVPFAVTEAGMKNDALKSLQGIVLSLMRMAVGLTFMSHGMQKVLGMLGGKVVPLASMAGFGGILELVGGGLILVGLFTRPVAFLLSGEMAVAYFMVHAPNGLWPIVNHGELAVVYCFVFFYLASSGAGPVSLDRLLPGGGRR